MTRFGYTLMTEQSGPKALVGYADAERVGFDFEVSSDHYFPWLPATGHAPYARAVLGAVAHASERVELMTCVRRGGRGTCSACRYDAAPRGPRKEPLSVSREGAALSPSPLPGLGARPPCRADR